MCVCVCYRQQSGAEGQQEQQKQEGYSVMEVSDDDFKAWALVMRSRAKLE